MDFAGRSIVITGVGRVGQVGEAIATAFAERGARVFLVDRQESAARERADILVAAGRRAAGLGADLTDATAVSALATRVGAATGGRVHALVHLAGGFAMSGPVSESDGTLWPKMFAINATTAYLTARAFLPLLRVGRGTIVFFASAAVLPGARTAEMSAYAAAKSAVVALMQSIAQEEMTNGVRANAVAPGAIRTAANLATMGDGAALISREDIASIVLLLCSDEARVITGQIIPVR